MGHGFTCLSWARHLSLETDEAHRRPVLGQIGRHPALRGDREGQGLRMIKPSMLFGTIIVLAGDWFHPYGLPVHSGARSRRIGGSCINGPESSRRRCSLSKIARARLRIFQEPPHKRFTENTALFGPMGQPTT